MEKIIKYGLISFFSNSVGWEDEKIYIKYIPKISGCANILKSVFLKIKSSNLRDINCQSLLFYNW